MRLRPQARGNDQGIDSLFLPPDALVAPPMEFSMMQPTNRNGEPITDFPPHRPLLRKFDVVGIRGRAAADKTGLCGHKPQMVAIALAYRFADDGDFLRAVCLLLLRPRH